MSNQQNQLPPLDIPKSMLPGAADALRHWHEHRPMMYTQLHQQGKLFDAAIAADEATFEDLDSIHNSLIKQGWDSSTAFVEAKQIVRERYIHLPTEEDVPELATTESGIYIYQPEETG